MEKTQLRVCVIGAGMSGLAATKELLDEGHQVVCFERQERVGGNFNYPSGAAYDQMRLTISNYFMAFSSMPPDLSEERRHWARKEYSDYLDRYAERFGVLNCMRYGVDVQRISPTSDGKFVVKLGENGSNQEETFDAVAVCIGAHRPTSPRIPTFNGQESFRGEITHTADYKNADRFAGKRVLCVGFGETAADVANQISEVASESWISFRRYPSLVGRGSHGFTNDSHSTRVGHSISRHIVNAEKLRKARYTLSNPNAKTHAKFMADWQIKCGTPSYQFLQKNDDFIDAVVSGKLKVIASGIDSLDGNVVKFTNGEEIEADIIMCCTGYEENGLPDLIDGGDPITDVRSLFKHMIHPELGPRLAFIGWARPVQGGVPACSEMQSRYFALLCSNRRQLPSVKRMKSVIESDRKRDEEMFYVQAHMKTLVLYTPYLDSLAKLIGCKPRLWTYIFQPRLLYRLLFGSNVSASYRLRGPHKNPTEAKRVIMHLPAYPMPLKSRARQVGLAVYSRFMSFVGAH